eukprot:GHVU01135771.1.p1 GENE.GHVU01135771.1~~GHVU01135771.1.p1  ORF type:complete len:832 (+),score=107.00 GHVU01135771.1:248-2497(+)
MGKPPVDHTPRNNIRLTMDLFLDYLHDERRWWGENAVDDLLHGNGRYLTQQLRYNLLSIYWRRPWALLHIMEVGSIPEGMAEQNVPGAQRLTMERVFEAWTQFQNRRDDALAGTARIPTAFLDRPDVVLTLPPPGPFMQAPRNPEYYRTNRWNGEQAARSHRSVSNADGGEFRTGSNAQPQGSRAPSSTGSGPGPHNQLALYRNRQIDYEGLFFSDESEEARHRNTRRVTAVPVAATGTSSENLGPVGASEISTTGATGTLTEALESAVTATMTAMASPESPTREGRPLLSDTQIDDLQKKVALITATAAAEREAEDGTRPTIPVPVHFNDGISGTATAPNVPLHILPAGGMHTVTINGELVAAETDEAVRNNLQAQLNIIDGIEQGMQALRDQQTRRPPGIKITELASKDKPPSTRVKQDATTEVPPPASTGSAGGSSVHQEAAQPAGSALATVVDASVDEGPTRPMTRASIAAAAAAVSADVEMQDGKEEAGEQPSPQLVAEKRRLSRLEEHQAPGKVRRMQEHVTEGQRGSAATSASPRRVGPHRAAKATSGPTPGTTRAQTPPSSGPTPAEHTEKEEAAVAEATEVLAEAAAKFEEAKKDQPPPKSKLRDPGTVGGNSSDSAATDIQRSLDLICTNEMLEQLAARDFAIHSKTCMSHPRSSPDINTRGVKSRRLTKKRVGEMTMTEFAEAYPNSAKWRKLRKQLRITVDYRKTNQQLNQLQYPFPDQEECVQHLPGGKVLGRLTK